MKIYSSESKFNKNKSENSETRVNTRKLLIICLFTLTLISLLISAPVTLFSTTVAATEPSLESILNDLGFTNIALADSETFSPGMYNATLLAEFAGYHGQNLLSHYAVETSNFQTIFTGPEGATGTLGGSVDPQISKTINVVTQFGLSMLSPEHRYFTEHDRNGDYPEEHSKVYRNLNDPKVFLIGFENKYGRFDRDYNDMVLSFVPISPPEIVSVTRFPENPNYDQVVTITAQVTRGSVDIDSVILNYQIDAASWTNVTMSLESFGYVADIPVQPYNTTVNYKVYASDTLGNSDVSALYSYTVGDSVSPVISNVLQVPNSPNHNEAVTVSAVVTEPLKASGVKNVTLGYTNNTVWSFQDMTIQDGLWIAMIPSQNPGTTVKFFVEAFDSVGNSAKTFNFSYTVLIPNRSPIAVLMYWPPFAFTGEVVEFDASASHDPDGYIVSYFWDFGDGTNASGATASHSYVEDGEYFVTLRIVDNEGLETSKVAVQVVKNRYPVAALTESMTIINKNEVISFDASPSYDPDGTIVNYQWNFGDGSIAAGVTVSHSYADNDVYTVTLTVIDNDGAIDSVFVTKLVVNSPPVASFTATAETVNINETISFDASESYDPDGSILSYTWKFGDGNTATGATTEHMYTETGNYIVTVTLTVTDDDGATDITTTIITSTTKTVPTVPNQSPVASFTKSATTASTSESIHFDGSTSYDSDGTIVNYTWKFGDGNTATGATTEHMYTETGNYIVTVTLTVTDDDGASSAVVAELVVENIVVETETTVSLVILSVIGLAITALTLTLLYGLFIRRKKNKKTKEN